MIPHRLFSWCIHVNRGFLISLPCVLKTSQCDGLIEFMVLPPSLEFTIAKELHRGQWRVLPSCCTVRKWADGACKMTPCHHTGHYRSMKWSNFWHRAESMHNNRLQMTMLSVCRLLKLCRVHSVPLRWIPRYFCWLFVTMHERSTTSDRWPENNPNSGNQERALKSEEDSGGFVGVIPDKSSLLLMIWCLYISGTAP